MRELTSRFAQRIEAALCYREALGFSRKPHEDILFQFDQYCADRYPDDNILTKELVLKWLESRASDGAGSLHNKAGALRFFGKYLDAMGAEAYTLPNNFIGSESRSPIQFIFTDDEMSRLFSAADTLPAKKKNPYRDIIAPVVFRLIYTCGLRPNEGRELKRRHIRFDTGEVFIAGNKTNKERLIVMSDDMLSLCKAYDCKL